jgi:hypothetical protein
MVGQPFCNRFYIVGYSLHVPRKIDHGVSPDYNNLGYVILSGQSHIYT